MADTTKVKIKVGFADQLRDIEVVLPVGERLRPGLAHGLHRR